MGTRIHVLESLLVQEKEYLLAKKVKRETIGVPKETSENETRVAVIPELVEYLVEEGYEVFVEENAGLLSGFSDLEYSESGAVIVKRESIYKCNILFKILPPTIEEISLMNENTVLFSSLQIYEQNTQYFQTLLGKKITAVAYELIKDSEGLYPFLQSMSEITGIATSLIASEYLSHPKYGKGMMLGGITGLCPAEVVVVGTGVVAQYAVPAFVAMGASVKVFDYSLSNLRRFKSRIHSNIYTGNINDKEFKDAIIDADVVITALYSDEYLSPCIISEDIIKRMEDGSLVIDVSIDQGGCVETSTLTTLKNPVYQKYQVTHYCVPNIAARFPKSASIAISKNILTILQELTKLREISSLFTSDPNLQDSIYTHAGMLTNVFISNKFGLRYHNLKFLFNKFWG